MSPVEPSLFDEAPVPVCSNGQGARPLRRSLWLHVHPSQVATETIRTRYTWCAGGMSFLLFLILGVTGGLLMAFYRPSAEWAYADVRALTYQVPFGALLRNSHRWAGHAMVALVALHTARVFLTGSYQPPRELNWIVGVALFFLTLALSFTGYLLPWDQLAYWAVSVGTALAAAIPVVGQEGPGATWLGLDNTNDLRAVMLGGPTIGDAALVRFYALHCFILPGLTLVLCFYHFWRVRRDGGVRGNL